jgi:chemotaxis protein MotB
MTHPKRRKHAQDPEEHENHERWLVSYADMITVLMALFIVLFAMSSVDTVKFQALKESLATSFGNPITAVTTGKSPTVGDSAATEGFLDTESTPATSPDIAQQISKAVDRTRAQDALREADRVRAAVEREARTLEKVRKAMLKVLATQKLAGSVKFRYDDRGLVVSVITDRVLFAADRAELTPVGLKVLDVIAPVLVPLPNHLLVEGHTNTVPVQPKYYPSDWELSSARATTVVRHLITADGLQPERMSATGFADQHPLIPGTGPVANRVNRRVEIVVASMLPPAERALLPEIAATIPTEGS